jgi:hypothetical protein
MSNFNEANDLASQLCWGRSYMGDVPMKLDRIVLRKTREFREEVIITVPDEAVPTKHDTWAKVASRLHRLMLDGFVPSYEGGVEEGGLTCNGKHNETEEI